MFFIPLGPKSFFGKLQMWFHIVVATFLPLCVFILFFPIILAWEIYEEYDDDKEEVDSP